jgi:hypothetical protein
MTARISVMLWGPHTKWVTIAVAVALLLASCGDDDYPSPFWPEGPKR